MSTTLLHHRGGDDAGFTISLSLSNYKLWMSELVKTPQDSTKTCYHQHQYLIMAGTPDNDKLSEIAKQAERDLNSYRSKTGSGRDQATDYEAAGVSDVATSKFPGASAKYGDDFVSSKSYDRRIPPDEGGDIDDCGR